MKLSELITVVEQIAPPHLALPDDPIGLHLGDPDQDIERCAVCLDVTPDVWRQAQAGNCQAILTHHPLIYHPLKSLTERTPLERLLSDIIRARVAVYALHTNWDAADDGLNHALARAAGLESGEPLEITFREKQLKMVVFVPLEALDAVRLAIGCAGAGVIGDYSFCSFRAPGQGAFLPGETATPHTGMPGRFEEVEEYRLEVVLPERLLDSVEQAMLEAHPYEEPAWDVYELRSPGRAYGIGLIGPLKTPTSFVDLKTRLSSALGHPALRSAGEDHKNIRTLAVCGGAGGSLLELAAAAGADAYLTSDVRHHEFIAASALGLCLIDGTHYATEIIGMRHLAEKLQSQTKERLEVVFIP